MESVPKEGAATSIYKSLDPSRHQIRVLHVEEAVPGESVLRCRSEVLSLANDQEPQSYEAISYCWGDSTTRVDIEIDGSSLQVPINSEAAIRCMSQQHGRRCIWIDAICINQADVEERNQQVALMDRVYSLAEQVLVWLGDLPTRPFSPLVAVRRLMVDVEANMGPEWEDVVVRHQSPTPGAWSPRPLRDMLAPPVWAIWSSKWFTRLWVLQEIVLARAVTVFHDRESVPFPHLIAAAWASRIWVPDVSGRDILKSPENVLMMNTLVLFYRRNASDAMFSFGLLLWDTQTYQCTEPRDKVYALLGLWKQQSRSRRLAMGIDVDYSKSFAEIYAQALRVAILDQGNLDPLTAMTVAPLGESKANLGLPSWAPTPNVYTSYQRPFEMSHSYATGSGESFRNVRRANDTTQLTMDYEPMSRDGSLALCMKGIAVDEVCHLSPLDGKHVYARPMGPGESAHVSIGVFVQYIFDLLSWIKSHLVGREDEDLIHLLLNTWMGREIDDTKHEQIPEYGKLFREELLVFLEEYAAGEPLEYRRVVCMTRDEITEATIRASMDFTVFVTADLRLGLGLRQMQPGDKGSYIRARRAEEKLEEQSTFFEIR